MNTHSRRLAGAVLGIGLLGGVHLKAPKDTPMANVMLTLLHRLGLDDMPSFGDSTGEFSFAADETTVA